MFVDKQKKRFLNKENELQIASEKAKGGFVCCNCGKWVAFSETIGTAHRNHCPFCLFSKHLDKELSGDRAANCGGCMRPIGLSFKKEGLDKYGHEKEGELMLIHKCADCEGISLNRLAADDEEAIILSVFNESLSLSGEALKKLEEEDIDVVGKEGKEKVFIKLFGKGMGKV